MNQEILMVLRLLLAAVFGGVIGYQRERLHKPAGLRTHMLICMGATLFTLVSAYGFGDTVDPSRIAAGVVTGIGFLGAGSIILRREENFVAGLTTAATIWISAGIGVGVGVGLYIASAVATALTLLVLYLPHPK